MAAPKSANAIAKISSAEDAIPGSAKGKVAVKKLTHPLAPRLLEAFSIDPSATRKAATIGHRTKGKRKKIMTRVIPAMEYTSNGAPSPPRLCQREIGRASCRERV